MLFFVHFTHEKLVTDPYVFSTRYVEVQNEAPNEKSKFWALFGGLFARKRTPSETSNQDDKKIMKKLPDFKE